MLTQLLPSSLSSLSLISPTRLPAHLPWAPPIRRPVLLPFPVRMGGGPRTYPGGVSKWQWKRMQAKKAKQLLKARLLRERQTYEMRKRAELKAAVYELEKPWELVEKAPTLLSVSADEQLKVLADRFQRPGGFDMWSDRDGPQVFRRNHDGSILPSRRFFPKGVVHSLKPYGLVGSEESVENDEDEVGFDDLIARGGVGRMMNDCRQGVRLNADEKTDGDSGCIDVEASVVGPNGHVRPGGNVKNMGRSSRRVALRPTSELNYDDDIPSEPTNVPRLPPVVCENGHLGSGGNGKNIGRSRRRVALRPTSELNSDDGSNRVRDYSTRIPAEPMSVPRLAPVVRENRHMGPGGNVKNMGRSGRSAALRPTSELNSGDGGNRARYSSTRIPSKPMTIHRLPPVVRENGHLGPGGNGKNMGRSRRGVTLRPMSELNSDDGGNMVRDSTWRKPRDGHGFGRNRGKSL